MRSCKGIGVNVNIVSLLLHCCCSCYCSLLRRVLGLIVLVAILFLFFILFSFFLILWVSFEECLSFFLFFMVFLFFLYFLSILLWQTVGMCASGSVCVCMCMPMISLKLFYFFILFLFSRCRPTSIVCAHVVLQVHSVLSLLLSLFCALLFSLCVSTFRYVRLEVSCGISFYYFFCNLHWWFWHIFLFL